MTLQDWNKIQSSKEYWDYSPDDRFIIKSQWFKENIEPTQEYNTYNDEDKSIIRSQFLQPDTAPPKPIIKEAGTAIARGLDQFGVTLGALGEMAHVPGAESFKDYYKERAARPEVQKSEYLQHGNVISNPERVVDPRWWINAFGENLPSLVVPMGAGGMAFKSARTAGKALPVAIKAASAAGIAPMMGIEAGAAFDDAKTEMINSGYDEKTADKIATAEGLIVGTVNGLLEKVPISNFFGNLGGRKLLARAIRQGLAEGGVEAAQENVNMIVGKALHGSNIDLKDWIGRTVESGLIGGGMGSTLGALHGGDSGDAGQKVNTFEDIPDINETRSGLQPPTVTQRPDNADQILATIKEDFDAGNLTPEIIAAIKQQLPQLSNDIDKITAQPDEVIKLRDQILEKEKEVGRKLTEDEVIELQNPIPEPAKEIVQLDNEESVQLKAEPIKVQRSSDEAGENTQYEVIEGPQKGSSISRGALTQEPGKYAVDESLMPSVARKAEVNINDAMAKELEKAQAKKALSESDWLNLTEKEFDKLPMNVRNDMNTKYGLPTEIKTKRANAEREAYERDVAIRNKDLASPKPESKAVQQTELTESGGKAKEAWEMTKGDYVAQSFKQGKDRAQGIIDLARSRMPNIPEDKKAFLKNKDYLSFEERKELDSLGRSSIAIKHKQLVKQALSEGKLSYEEAEKLGHFKTYPDLKPTDIVVEGKGEEITGQENISNAIDSFFNGDRKPKKVTGAQKSQLEKQLAAINRSLKNNTIPADSMQTILERKAEIEEVLGQKPAEEKPAGEKVTLTEEQTKILTKYPKSRKATEIKESVGIKSKPGSVYLDKGGRKPFFEYKEIKRGVKKGKYSVTLTNGKKVVVNKEAIREFPSAQEDTGNKPVFLKEAKEEEVYINSLTTDVLDKMSWILRTKGYDIKGSQDLRDMMKKGRKIKDGKFIIKDWQEAYEQVKRGKIDRKEKPKDDYKNIDWDRLKELGKTLDHKEAGYIAPDGSYIDLSGKKEGGQRGNRSYDHREAGGTAGMQEIMEFGYIRMDENAGALNLGKEPTPKQIVKIKQMIDRHNGEVAIELFDGLGKYQDGYYSENRRWSKFYDNGAKAEQIINDIKRFFSGETPIERISFLKDLTPTGKTLLTKQGVENIIKGIKTKLPNIGNFEVVKTQDELPEFLFREQERDYSRIYGVYDPLSDTIYIVADNLKDRNAVLNTVIHEAIGHRGVDAVLTKPKRKQLFRMVNYEYGKKDIGQKIIKDYGLDLTNEADQVTFAREVIAHMAVNEPKASLMDRVISLIKSALRELGITLKISDAEIRSLLARSYKFAQTENEIADTEKSPAFSKESKISPEDYAKNLIARAGKKPESVKGKAVEKPAKTKEPKTSNFGMSGMLSNNDKAKQALNKFADKAGYWILDKNLPIAEIQSKLRKMTEELDLFLSETQRPKRTAAKIKQMWEDMVTPLLKTMGENQIDLGTLEEYKHAKHARERNEAMRKGNAKRYIEKVIAAAPKETKALQEEIKDLLWPEEWYAKIDSVFNEFRKIEAVKDIEKQWITFQEKPSGMSDKDADKILSFYQKDKAKLAKMEEVGKMVDAINLETIETLYNSGQIADKEYEIYKTKYKNYVPLHREGFEDESQGTGRGLQPAGRLIKTAMGSTRDVVNIVAHSITNLENAINRAEKAESAKILLNLVKQNPDPDLWTLNKVKETPRHDEAGNLKMYPDSFSVAPNEMRFMVNGEQYLLSMNRNNENAMRMLKTLKAEDSMGGPLVNALSKMNKWLARINTTWSPEFVITNFIKDIQAAGININDTGVESKRMFRGALSAIKSIHAVESGKGDGGDLGKYYKRFKDAGGKIGWSDIYGTAEKMSKELTKDIDMFSGKRPVRQVWQKTFKFIEDWNTSVENGVRLHAFKLAVDQGFSDKKAAQIASDLTVDFTKKGAAGPVINSLYLFANAGIQGSYRIFRAGMKSPKVRKIMGGIIGIGILNGLLNSAIGGEDDDGEDYYNKIDDFVKERNWIIMIPNSKGKYIKIPLPWGYNVLWNIGDEISKTITKEDYKPLQGAGRLLSVFAQAFNPIQSGTLLQTLSPTITDPFAMVAENKNWYGGDLMPQKNVFEKVPTPDSQRYWKTARDTSKWVAEKLNDWTGGNQVRKGAIDVSPETLDLIVDTMGGSAMRFFTDIAATPLKIARQEETSMRDYPFIRRAVGEKSQYADQRTYYENLTQVLTAKEELEAYKGTDYFNDLNQKLRDAKRMIPIAENSERRLRKLRKIRNRSENKVQIDSLNKQIEQIYVDFNKKFYNIVK